MPHSRSQPSLHHTEGVRKAWFILLIIGGQILLPILTITMLCSNKIRRDATLINVFVTWTLFSVIMCLLFYTGHQSGDEPPHGLCLAQATLAYATPPMVTTALLSLVIQVLCCLRDSTTLYYNRRSIVAKRRNYRTTALVVLPYFVFIVFLIASAVIGTRPTSKVSRSTSFFYCSIKSELNLISTAISAFIAMIVIPLEAGLSAAYYRRWAQGRVSVDHLFFDTDMIIQILLYSLISCVGWASHLVGVNSFPAFPWMFTAATPIALFFIFAVRRDVTSVWCGWIRSIWKKEDDSKKPRYTHYARQLSISHPILANSSQPHLPPQAHQRRGSRPDDLNTLNTLSATDSPSVETFSLGPSIMDHEHGLDRFGDWRMKSYPRRSEF